MWIFGLRYKRRNVDKCIVVCSIGFSHIILQVSELQLFDISNWSDSELYISKCIFSVCKLFTTCLISSCYFGTSAILKELYFIYWHFCFRQRKEKMKIFKTMGIPGPSPNFLFGNMLAFWYKVRLCYLCCNRCCIDVGKVDVHICQYPK